MTHPLDDDPPPRVETATGDDRVRTDPVPRSRVLRWGIGIGVATALGSYALLVLPVYLLASLDPDGLDRSFVRTALTLFALPAATVLGTAAGVVAGRMVARGQRWEPPGTGRGPYG